jgi:GT2 family glycosyltransferase
MTLPPTSLIICSRNRPELLHDTVHSILGGNEVPNEIIIIDQSQTPHPLLAEMKPIRGCEIRYCWSQTVGVSVARNIAMQMARYDFLAITDDDVFVAPDWLSMLINGLVDAGAKCVVSGKVLPAETVGGGFAPSVNTDDEPRSYEGRIWKDALYTNNMAMPRSVVAAIGFFDDRLGPGTTFYDGDDNDYGFRLLETGYRILYLPSAVVYHRAWRQMKDYLPLRWQYGLGRGAFYAKYLSLRDRYSFNRMLRDILNHVLSFPYHFRRERLIAYGDLVLAAGLIIGACRWLARYGSKPTAINYR